MTQEALTHAQHTARALQNVALGLEPDAAREVMEGADLIERQAAELERLRAALKQVTNQAGTLEVTLLNLANNANDLVKVIDRQGVAPMLGRVVTGVRAGLLSARAALAAEGAPAEAGPETLAAALYGVELDG